MHEISNIQVNFVALIVGVAGALVVGHRAGYYLRKICAELKIKESERLVLKIVDEAEKAAETRKKIANVDVRDEIFSLTCQMKK